MRWTPGTSPSSMGMAWTCTQLDSMACQDCYTQLTCFVKMTTVDQLRASSSSQLLKLPVIALAMRSSSPKKEKANKKPYTSPSHSTLFHYPWSPIKAVLPAVVFTAAVQLFRARFFCVGPVLAPHKSSLHVVYFDLSAFVHYVPPAVAADIPECRVKTNKCRLKGSLPSSGPMLRLNLMGNWTAWTAK